MKFIFMDELTNQIQQTLAGSSQDKAFVKNIKAKDLHFQPSTRGRAPLNLGNLRTS